MEYELRNGSLYIGKAKVALPAAAKQVLEFQSLLIVVMIPQGPDDNNVWALDSGGEVAWKVPISTDAKGSRFNYYDGVVIYDSKLRLFHNQGFSYFVDPADGSIVRDQNVGRPW